MVVDDEPANLAIVESILVAEGFAVRAFPNGRLALEAARNDPPEVVLLDIRMPGMDGYEVCRCLKKDPALSDTPVIFVSALHETEDIIRGFQAGGCDYVVKPIRAEELLARVRLHLALRRSRRELEARNLALHEQYGRLQTLEQMRDNLVHMLVHDLRAPLSGVSLMLESLVGGTCLPGEAMPNLEAASTAVRNVLHTLRTILDVSRLEDGKLPIRRTMLDAGDLIREALRTLDGLTQGREIRAEIQTPGVPVFADHDLCVRVIANLLDNALKHAPVDQPITVRAVPEVDAVRLTVQDRGPGIPPEDRLRVFNKFEAGIGGRKAPLRSSGLGLFFCQLAVQAHGGTIGVSSTIDCGSTFWVVLPRKTREINA